MSQAIPASSEQFRGKLARKILILLLSLSLIPLLILGGTSYLRARQLFNSQIEDTLLSLEEKETNRIDEWLQERERSLNQIPLQSAVIKAIRTVLEAEDRDSAPVAEGRELILSNLETLNQNETIFHQFLVLDPNGEVLVATRPDLEGASLADAPYYGELSQGESMLAYYGADPVYNTLAVIATKPIYEDDELLVTIWGVTGTALIEELFAEVGLLNSRNYLVTMSGALVGVGPNIKEASPSNLLEPSDDQLELFTAQLDDTSEDVVEFTSFDGQEVLATYTPLPRLNAGLVTELPATKFRQQTNALIPFFVGLVAVSFVLAGFLIRQGAQTIVRPVNEIAKAAQHFAEGDWRRRANVDRDDEIGWLAYSFNQMAQELSTLYRSLEFQVDERTEQIQTAAEVAQIATSTTSLDKLLQRTVQLVVERFGFYHAAIYLLDERKENAILRKSFSTTGGVTVESGTTVDLSSRSIIGQVASTNQPYVAADVSEDPYYLPFAGLPETQSEAVIPLSAGAEVLGILDVQSDQPNAFESADVITLETLASQIVSTLRNIRILETTRTDLQATSTLYQASNKIAEAESPLMVLEALAETLKQTPFISALFEVEVDSLYGISIFDPSGRGDYPSRQRIDVNTEEIEAAFQEPVTLTLADKRIAQAPDELIELLKGLRCQAFSFFPIMPSGELEALLILGSESIDRLTPANLQPYYSLVEITRTALEKVKALETIQQRLIELRSINAVSQSIASETDIDSLYRQLDRHINQVMGEVSFLIALYSKEKNTIEIPYMHDGPKVTSVPPFPLGQGLTSIVIRTRQPLMLVEDTVRRSRALGAIITETGAAKSWLGVPLLIHDEPIGVMVVQDLEHEHRFNEDDLQLLTTLASQVAIAVRNAYLLESSQQRAERERQLFDVTAKIRHAPDIQGVLQTTAEEISALLGARRTRISIAEEFMPRPQAEPGDEER